MIQIIPAIDIKNGKVVRLAQGEAGRETIYPDSPVEAARKWDACGVGLIHIVDLDGAMKGSLKNFIMAKKIAEGVKAKVELGGGIREESVIGKVLDAGIAKVVIGTKALDEGFVKRVVETFGERIVVGIDARDGFVFTKGWLSKTKISALDLIKRIEACGVRTVNYTDISKDGMLEGPSIDSLREILSSTSMDVIASGGVSTIEDVKRLKALEGDGLKGMIIGKALYEGKVGLAEAMKICSQNA